MRSGIVAAGAALIIAGAAAPARADVSAEAEALYTQGQEMLAAKKLDAACAAFDRSDKLEPRGGTLLSLAYCHEQQGKIGLAYVEYDEALRRLRVGGGRPDRERFALERLGGLRSQVVMVSLELSDAVRALNPEIVVLPAKAGESERKLALSADKKQNVPLDVNGGTYRIEVRAAQRKPFVAEVQVAQTTATPAALSVSSLLGGPVAAGAPAGAAVAGDDPPAEDGSGRRTTGLIVAGIGVPFLVVGAVFGAKALGCNSDHNAWVDGGKKGDEPCDASAARSVDANIANAGLGLGVVGLAVGGYLYFTAPKGSGKVGVAPLVSPSATGLSLRARF